MLKQSAFFNKLKKKNLTVQSYYILYNLYNEVQMNRGAKQIIKEKYKSLSVYITDDCKVNKEGEKLIKSIETFFKPIKQLKNIELLGDNYKENIDQFLDIFPKGKLPNGKYARGNKKNIETHFMWFFQEHDYNWNTILIATEKYVDEYHKNNYKFMRTAMYFIKKVIDGTSQSELATYCQAHLDGEDKQKIIFKKKVV